MSEEKAQADVQDENQAATTETVDDVVEAEVETAQADENESDEALQAANAQIAELQDQLLRVQADMQNTRRRSEREVENAHKYSVEKIVKELLPVIDNLERAVESFDATDERLKGLSEGVEMTLRMFADGLKKFQVEAIDPMGEPFDPQQHEAMSMQENANVEPNTVIAVFQKGYSLHGRLVRPAMVVVSKASAASKVDEQA